MHIGTTYLNIPLTAAGCAGLMLQLVTILTFSDPLSNLILFGLHTLALFAVGLSVAIIQSASPDAKEAIATLNTRIKRASIWGMLGLITNACAILGWLATVWHTASLLLYGIFWAGMIWASVQKKSELI